MRRAYAALLGLMALSALSTSAHALVTQPNGLVVPIDSKNGETQIAGIVGAALQAGI